MGVVIVAYNSARHLPRLIDSLPSAGLGLELEVVVVDNASTDDSVAVCASLGVDCIATGMNGGYSRAINIGTRRLQDCDAILVCNPDVRLSRGAIAALWDDVALTRGVAVPLLKDDVGVLAKSQRRFPSVLGQLGEAVLGDCWSRRPAILTEIVRDSTAYSTAHPIEWATGAVVMTHRECVRAVGPWNEDYFLFSEEVDFMARCRDAGYTIRFCPEAIAWHTAGGSGRSAPLASLAATNRLRFYGGRHNAAMTAVFGVTVLLQMVLRSIDPAHRRAALDVARAVWPAMKRSLPPATAPRPEGAWLPQAESETSAHG